MERRSGHSSEVLAHQAWLGFVQPVGLVVSLPALEKAQCFVQRNVQEAQRVLLSVAIPKDDPKRVDDLGALLLQVLGYAAGDLQPASDRFFISLPDYEDELRPTSIIVDPDNADGATVLVLNIEPGADLDEPVVGRGWCVSPQARFERLLRETGVPMGLLFNHEALRLVYAPRGESSGHVTFWIRDMVQVSGRPILAGLLALLSAERVLNLGSSQRLSTILEESRKYQSVVSTKLAEQMLGALHELVRGFQTANEVTGGTLLDDVLGEAPNEVYEGLVTTLLRLVFLVFAEDREILPKDAVISGHYSVGALFEKLRDDAARYPDTMDQRYGAWSRLLVLFRLVHDGASHGSMRLPARHGYLFDPDGYPFLEGRRRGSTRVQGARLTPPRVSDGVVHRVLEKLLLLDGERLSYRTLDVEQIGSVYEALIGFELVVVDEASVYVRGKSKKGAAPADPVISLDTLRAKKGPERTKYLKEAADVELTGSAAAAVREAKNNDALVAALGRRVSPRSPGILPKGSLALRATDERRRAGAHYTPRSLTEPIVERTLEPVLTALGKEPKPEQILSLKVCDPAMGSGAFLVAASRQLGRVLEASWRRHGFPKIPGNAEPGLHARRLVAQRCLYGVDRNPLAVQLAQLSLWLDTLSKDHAFTFMEHALRCGDSLVGLLPEQILSVHWAPAPQLPIVRELMEKLAKRRIELREQLRQFAVDNHTEQKRAILREFEDTTSELRRIADHVVAAFMASEQEKGRLQRLEAFRSIGSIERMTAKAPGLPVRLRPLHWPLEFPEVFDEGRGGFDAIVGNPPFLGGKRISTVYGDDYRDWLSRIHSGSNQNADLAAHFFRRAFDLLGGGGAFGLIATNTIAQGDTRATGLRPIVEGQGVIYEATRRYRWASAAVIVSIVHVAKKPRVAFRHRLDGQAVPRISAFLFHTGPDADPVRLAANAGKSFQGSIVLGMGFTFDDSKPDAATPIVEMERLIWKSPKNRERIFPYLGGDELNSSPVHAHHRYVINFGQMSEAEAQRWPDLLRIVEQRVKEERRKKSKVVANYPWWQHWRPRPELYEAIRGLPRVVACSLHSKDLSFVRVAQPAVFSHALAVFADDRESFFAMLQSRPHELWARFLASSLEDRLRYTPSDCFETFPFPAGWETNATLESRGKAYYEFRARLMVKNNQGLTETYNRFHDPDERDPEIKKLRDLHAAMDRAVLDAYGWNDIQPTCEFLLDYEEDEDDEESENRRRRKPYRFRWSDDVRDEVLARLLALNAERAEEEKRQGIEAGLRRSEEDNDESEEGESDELEEKRRERRVPQRRAAKVAKAPAKRRAPKKRQPSNRAR